MLPLTTTLKWSKQCSIGRIVQQNIIVSKNRTTLIWSIDFRQRCQDNSMMKASYFNKWCLNKWIFIWDKLTLTHHTYTCKKRITNLKVKFEMDHRPKSKTLKLLKENIQVIGLGKDFLGRTHTYICIHNNKA